MTENIPHQPIMVAEILDALRPKDHHLYIDGTLGAGGHTAAILSVAPQARIIAFDRDPEAIALAKSRLEGFDVTIIHDSYISMQKVLHSYDIDGLADGILLDLGASSMQFDRAERGFAFRLDGPLDMRFDPSSDGPTAADLVNELPADALADILYRFGEEKQSRRIARAIVEARPIYTTRQLATLIEKLPHSREKIHPATRTFQALRIAVNDELKAVEAVIPMAIACLRTGGRLAVLTFHSLEDRLVKQAFKQAATDCLCPPKQPLCTCGHVATVRLINRKPIVASETEIKDNQRARSAKLRVVERLPTS